MISGVRRETWERSGRDLGVIGERPGEDRESLAPDLFHSCGLWRSPRARSRRARDAPETRPRRTMQVMADPSLDFELLMRWQEESLTVPVVQILIRFR